MACVSAAKISVATPVATVRAPRAQRAVACRAEKKANLAGAAAAAALAAAFTFGVVEPARADVAGLTPCAESKAFQKRQKKSVKDLTKRQAKYEAGSAPALALQATIDKTNARFEKYAKSGLLCGTDGLPHLIADPGLALRYGHGAEVFGPTFGFLYVAGLIGHAGREYLKFARAQAKPNDNEIIINVPEAMSILGKSLVWPVATIAEWNNGTLLEKDENITVSPR